MKTNKWIFAMMLMPLIWMGCNDDDNDNADKRSLNDTDETFVEKTARGNMAEIEFGKVAVTKATDSLVRTFAQKMIDDHTQAQNELQDIADDFAGIEWPNDLDEDHDAIMARLDSTDAGYSFDTLYIATQVMMHEDAKASFETATTNSTETRLKSYATKYLPTIEEHLAEADSIQTAIMEKNETSD